MAGWVLAVTSGCCLSPVPEAAALSVSGHEWRRVSDRAVKACTMASHLWSPARSLRACGKGKHTMMAPCCVRFPFPCLSCLDPTSHLSFPSREI